jgi:hypothetical protein
METIFDTVVLFGENSEGFFLGPTHLLVLFPICRLNKSLADHIQTYKTHKVVIGIVITPFCAFTE